MWGHLLGQEECPVLGQGGAVGILGSAVLRLVVSRRCCNLSVVLTSVKSYSAFPGKCWAIEPFSAVLCNTSPNIQQPPQIPCWLCFVA